MIYFIQDQTTLHIKVGYTDGDVRDRLRTLQTGNPSKLVVLHVMRGDRTDEKTLHEWWSDARVQGEWFKPMWKIFDFLIEGVPPCEWNGHRRIDWSVAPPIQRAWPLPANTLSPTPEEPDEPHPQT